MGNDSIDGYAPDVESDAIAAAFEEAADAVISGDTATLSKLLLRHPELVHARSGREHRSTLLHFVSANGVEDFRQMTPPNIVEVTTMLLDSGSEVDAKSEAYGGGCTALGLVATSVHPQRAGLQFALLELLLARGASPNLPSAGGNGQSVVPACYANGQPQAAEFLIAHGGQ